MAGSYSVDQEDIDGEDGAQYGRIQTRNPFSHKESAHGVIKPWWTPFTRRTTLTKVHTRGPLVLRCRSLFVLQFRLLFAHPFSCVAHDSIIRSLYSIR